MTITVRCEWEIPAVLGEGPVWVAREAALYWVDIYSRQLHRFQPDIGDRRSWTMADLLTSLAPRAAGGFIGTTRHGFAWVDLKTGRLLPAARPKGEPAGNRFNDGKLDPHGRYWAGSMDNAEMAPNGALYRLDHDLSIQRLDDGYVITNGPAFSRDGRTLYHTDSTRRTIYAFNLDERGAISHRRVFVRLEDEAEGYPDGMTVDAEDCLWLAHFGGAKVTRFSPVGQVLQVVPMPVPNVTSCAFGGPALDTLYVTTARHLLNEEALQTAPLSGSLFSFRPGVTGLPSALFPG